LFLGQRYCASQELGRVGTHRYNCLSWAGGETRRKWWPDPTNIGYWPKGVPRIETLDAFVSAYGTLGYGKCENDSLEPGFEKIALFTKRYPDGTRPTHAARQLPSGRWTSKLGDCEDIEHEDLEVLHGPAYGMAVWPARCILVVKKTAGVCIRCS